MKPRVFRRYLRIVIILFACTLPAAALAQNTDCTPGANGFVPLACVEQSPRLAGLYSSGDLASFVQKLFTFALVVGAIGGVLRLAYAGYLYMGQSDMWSHKGEARKIIGDVTLGLLLLLAIWLILYQINPDILSLRALQNIKPVPTSNAPTSGAQTNTQTDTQSGSSVFDPGGGGSGY